MKKPTGPKPNLKQTLEIIEREISAGNFKRAETIAAHLHVNYPRRPEVNLIMGNIEKNLRQEDLALHFYKRCVEAEPYNIDYLSNVGSTLATMGLAHQADATYKRILEIDPNAHAAARALAEFYNEIGMGERALEYFDKALQIAPPHLRPKINMRRLDCLVGLGRTDEVEKVFEAGLETGGFRVEYISLYATLDKWNVTSQAYQLVVEELQNPELTLQERGDLLTRKARIEENSGFYDQSYETLEKAKRTNLAKANNDGFRRRCDLRINTITREFVKECNERLGHPSDRHILVVGMPRSGTTLTEQIIASHSLAGGVGELETLSYLSHKLYKKRPASELAAAIDELGPEGVLKLGMEYEAATEFLAPGKAHVVDKMPHNFVQLGEIAILFPKARFVHCIRNPADTFISAFQNDMGPGHAYSYDRDTYAEYYENYLRLMRHWYEVLPGRIFTLNYEQLVTTPEPVIRSLLEFLGLPFEEACLNPQDSSALVKTFSRLQVRSAINPKSVGRWRKYEKQLAPLAKRFENLEPFPPIS